MVGYNENFESWVVDGTNYNTYYIKFNEFDKSGYTWGDYIHEDNMVIIAAGPGESAGIETILEAALGLVVDNNTCITTTSTTTVAPSTTTTTTTLTP